MGALHFFNRNRRTLSLHQRRSARESARFYKRGLLHYILNNPHKKRINILEMGFGTGLNALLALKVGIDYKLEILIPQLKNIQFR